MFIVKMKIQTSHKQMKTSLKLCETEFLCALQILRGRESDLIFMLYFLGFRADAEEFEG